MANVGPPGGGKDSISEVFNKVLPPNVIKKVIEASKQINTAMKVMAKNILLASRKRIEANKQERSEREYNLRQNANAAKSLERQKQAAALKQFNAEERSTRSLSLQRSREYVRNLNSTEASKRLLERQKVKAYAEEIRKQEQAKKALDSQRSKSYSRQISEDEKKRVKDVKDSARALQRLNDQRSKQYARDIRQQEAAKNKLDSQRSRQYTRDINEEEKKKKKDLSDQAKAAASLARQRSMALDMEQKKQARDAERNVRTQEAAKRKLESQRSRAYERELVNKEKEEKRLIEEKKKKEKEKQERSLSNVPDFFGGIVSGVKQFMGILGDASKFVGALNPGLILQLGFAFKDLYATIGLALQPVVEGMIAGIRTLADFLVPISKELAPLFANLTTAFLDLFVSLFPFFRDLLSVVGLLIQWFTLFIKAITFLIDPIIMALTGFSVILIVEAIPAVIAFATSILTMTTLMTAGISLVIGAIASLAFWFLRTVGVFKSFDFKPGVSAGMGARQASYTGISDFGKNLLQQGLGSSTANAGLQTANNTKRCADLLQDMKDGNGWKKAAGNIMFGGPGVKVERVGGKELKQNPNPFLKFAAGLMF